MDKDDHFYFVLEGPMCPYSELLEKVLYPAVFDILPSDEVNGQIFSIYRTKLKTSTNMWPGTMNQL